MIRLLRRVCHTVWRPNHRQVWFSNVPNTDHPFHGPPERQKPSVVQWDSNLTFICMTPVCLKASAHSNKLPFYYAAKTCLSLSVVNFKMISNVNVTFNKFSVKSLNMSICQNLYNMSVKRCAFYLY